MKNIYTNIFLLLLAVCCACGQSTNTEDKEISNEELTVPSPEQNKDSETEEQNTNLSIEDNIEGVVPAFIAVLSSRNKAAIAATMTYPFARQSPLTDILDEEDCLLRFEEVFDDSLIQMIVESDPERDWEQVGSRGLMFRNGMLWLSLEGKLLAIDYQTSTEKTKLDEYKKAEQADLHESIATFEKAIASLETKRFKVRIDQLRNGMYRYASWPISSDTSQQPDLLMQNGSWEPNGSGGNHSYIFINGDYKYDCQITVLGESDHPTARLIVFNNGKEIVNEKATIVLR